MARPREFDADAVVEKAMQAFWARGYRATSIDDVCALTGLSRSSLYAAYGGKRALLHRSLERYEAQTLMRIDAALSGDVPIRKAISGFIDRSHRRRAGPRRLLHRQLRH